MDTQLIKVVCRLLTQLAGELETVFVHLFRSQLRENPSKVPLERLFGNTPNLFGVAAQEALDRVAYERRVAGNLNVCNRIHIQRNPASRIRPAYVDWNLHDSQAHPADPPDN